MRSTVGTLGSAAVALVLAAGTATPAMAGGTNGPVVTAAPSGNATALKLNGTPFRTTSARVANLRALTFPGSTRAVWVWDEWTGGAKTSYAALSSDGRTVAQVAPTGEKLKLKYAQFNPVSAAATVHPSLKAAAGNELFLVQLSSMPLDEMRAGISGAGGAIERYVPDNTFLVRMKAPARQRVAALPYVRWIGAYEPAYKLAEDVRADVLGRRPGAARYSIECLRSGTAQQQAVADFIRQIGGIVELTTPGQRRLEATLTPAQVLAVAQRNEVGYIDSWGGPGGTDMQVIRQLEGATPALAVAGFTGQGVRGEVHDTEVLITHQAFQTPPPLLHRNSAGTSPIEFHGSSCYGINFAHWDDAPFFNGMVTDAEQGIFVDWQLDTQGGGTLPRLLLNTEATDPNGPYRSCYQTSSVGSFQTTAYTTVSAEVDDYLFQVDYLSFQSQSNTGTRQSRPQAWAKNIVSVGGVNWHSTLDRSDDNWGGASFGPPDNDARQKPDLTNCYDNVPTTSGTGDSATTGFGGTSASTPITAGAGGLLMQMWHAGVWHGFGGGASVFADRPYSTTAKALLINTAYRYPLTQGSLTRDKQGWGMPDLLNMYNLRNKTFIVDNSRPLQQGQVATYTLTVGAGEPVLGATLCYIDPMPATGALHAQVNDLSLRLTAPDGTTVYWGNFGLTAGNFSTPGGSENHFDPVENVFVQNPAAGTWTVDVIATLIAQDAYPTGRPGVTPTGPSDAAFSLVVTGIQTGIITPMCYANCDLSTTVPYLNINDFICFQSKFAAGDTYANCDNSTTPPVLNVNDFLCFQSKFAAGCSAP